MDLWKLSAVSWIGFLMVADVCAASLVIGGSGTDLGAVTRLGELFAQQNPGINIEVLPSLGSGGGVRAVSDGRVHVGLTSRPLTPEERKLPVKTYLYAETPQTFVTGLDNHAENISLQEVQDVLAGKIRYWPDGQSIRIILRPMHDSDTRLLLSAYPQLSAADAVARKRRGVPVARTAQQAADLVASIAGSLGISSLAQVIGEQRPLKPLVFNGVEPSIDNLATGRYAMRKSLYLVLSDRPDALAEAFVHFFYSPEAVAVLEKTGHRALPMSLAQ